MPFKCPEAHRLNKIKRRDKAREVIRQYKLNNPCVDCGEDDPVVLEFDHINPQEKKFVIADAVGQGRGVKSILEEISKCEVRCANCHRRKTTIDRQLKYESKLQPE